MERRSIHRNEMGKCRCWAAHKKTAYTPERRRWYVNNASRVAWLNQQRLLFSLGRGHLLPGEIPLCYREPTTHRQNRDGWNTERTRGKIQKWRRAVTSFYTWIKKKTLQLLKCGQIVTSCQFQVFVFEKTGLAANSCAQVLMLRHNFDVLWTALSVNHCLLVLFLSTWRKTRRSVSLQTTGWCF